MTKEIDLDNSYELPLGKMIFSGNIKPNYNMTFHKDGKQIGVLDFNGPEMKFEGDFDESAKMFFDWIAHLFKSRLDQERAAERVRLANAIEAMPFGDTAASFAVWIREGGKE